MKYWYNIDVFLGFQNKVLRSIIVSNHFFFWISSPQRSDAPLLRFASCLTVACHLLFHRMAEDKALSSGSTDDVPTITVRELGKLSGLVAVPSTSTEALHELKLQGFTVEQEREGVKLLAPPGGRVAGYSMTKHSLNATRPQPGAIYPKGAAAGEYMQLPSVSRSKETQFIPYHVGEKPYLVSSKHEYHFCLFTPDILETRIIPCVSAPLRTATDLGLLEEFSTSCRQPFKELRTTENVHNVCAVFPTRCLRPP